MSTRLVERLGGGGGEVQLNLVTVQVIGAHLDISQKDTGPRRHVQNKGNPFFKWKIIFFDSTRCARVGENGAPHVAPSGPN